MKKNQSFTDFPLAQIPQLKDIDDFSPFSRDNKRFLRLDIRSPSFSLSLSPSLRRRKREKDGPISGGRLPAVSRGPSANYNSKLVIPKADGREDTLSNNPAKQLSADSPCNFAGEKQSWVGERGRGLKGPPLVDYLVPLLASVR